MDKIESTKPKPFCFVLMPFDKSFEDIYKLGIKEACIESGAYCERVDEQIYHETILERIYNQISKADFIVADMTGRNPNVFYEVGYAHTLGKRTVLLTQKAEDIPFDLKLYPHIIYGETGDKISKLKEDLSHKLEWLINNLNNDNNVFKIGIEFFYNNMNLSSEDAVYTVPFDDDAAPKITLYNSSSLTYNPGDFQIGVITSEKYDIHSYHDEKEIVKLPDGTFLHMLPNFETLFPQAYTSCNIIFDKSPEENEVDIITYRVFTKYGTRDYQLKMIKEEKPINIKKRVTTNT